MKKSKKLSKHIRYELSKYYGVKRDDMEAWCITFGAIGFFLKIPVLIVLDLVGMSEHAADNWSWLPMVPCLICGWIMLYFNFKSWLADPYKNI